MWLALTLVGSKLLSSSFAVGYTPILLEPNAATYKVAPSAETTRSSGIDRLCCLTLAGAGSTL